MAPLLKQVEETGIQPEIQAVGELAEFASKYPYYKYDNAMFITPLRTMDSDSRVDTTINGPVAYKM